MTGECFNAIAGQTKSDSNTQNLEDFFDTKEGEFFGFDSFKIELESGSITIVEPKVALPSKPWVWRGMFWENRKTYATGLMTLVDIGLLEAGFHIVQASGDSLGHPSGSEHMDAAYELLTESCGFSIKPAMVGVSRETLSVYRWASANPERVSSIYIDNGVCNLKSWPGGKLVQGNDSVGEGSAEQWTLMKERYGFESDLEALAYRENPVDILSSLADARVPLLHVSGDTDVTVPHSENTAILKERYENLGGSIKVIMKEGFGHHPHGLEDPSPVIDFILKNENS